MIKIAPLNKNNFLRWYPNVSASLDNSTYSTDIVNGYQYMWRTFPDQLPILVGDTLTFYTNFDSDSYLIGSSIGVVEEDSCGNYTIINDINKYLVTESNWGARNLKISLTIPLTNTDNLKRFRLAIISGGTTVTYVSNYFVTLQKTERNINNTHLISGYHTSNIFNYEWSTFDNLSDDFYQVRIYSSKVGIEYPSDKEIYKEATTGKSRVTRATTNKQINFEIYYNVEELHDAISTFSNFKYFGVNGNQYVVQEYEVNYEKNLNIFKGVLTLLDNNFNRRINTCLS